MKEEKNWAKPSQNSSVVKKLPRFMSECKSESKKWANHLQTTKVKVKNWAKPSRNSTVVKKLPRFMLKCKSESEKWANHLKNRKVKNWAKHLETRPLQKSCQYLCPNAKVKVKSGQIISKIDK